MNPTLSFLQKQGLKISLPLLLLATACGEGTSTSAFQPNSGGAAGRAITAAATSTTAGLGVPTASSDGLGTPDVTLPEDAEPTSLSNALPPSTTPTDGASAGGGSSSGGAAGAVASVPEPAALAGLAIAAAGMIVIKRKQTAPVK